MHDHVRIRLVFSRSGQSIPVNVSKDVALSSQGVMSAHSVSSAEQTQAAGIAVHPEPVSVSG